MSHNLHLSPIDYNLRPSIKSAHKLPFTHQCNPSISHLCVRTSINKDHDDVFLAVVFVLLDASGNHKSIRFTNTLFNVAGYQDTLSDFDEPRFRQKVKQAAMRFKVRIEKENYPELDALVDNVLFQIIGDIKKEEADV